MSTKQPTQPKVQKPEAAHQSAAPEAAQLGPELLPAGLAQVGSLNRLPDHGTARPLRQSTILQMQRRHGNEHVQRLLAKHNGHKSMPVALRPPTIQAKLAVNEPDEAYEQEADRVAETVMRQPVAAPPPPGDENGAARRNGGTAVAPRQRSSDHTMPAASSTGVSALPRQPLIQREEAGDEPNEEAKVAALAAARAAKAQARQAQNQSQQEVGKANASSSVEKQAKQVAKQKEDAAKAEAKSLPKGVADGAALPPTGDAGDVASGNGSGPATAVAGGAAPAPVLGVEGEKAPASAKEDPGFNAAISKIKQVGAKEKTHAPAKSKADAAQEAAVPPAGEVTSKAQAGQMGEMEAAETPPFDKAAFKARLMQKIEAMSPKTAEDADSFKSQDKAGAIKGEMTGEVEQQKAASQGPLEEKTAAMPDASGIEPKAVTPLDPEQPGETPGNVGASAAVPKPKGQGELEAPLQEDSQSLDQQMADADVTKEQLANSNEPEFTGALTSKNEAQTQAVAAPKEYREAEGQQLAQAQGEAEAVAQEKTHAMHADRAGLFAQVEAQQGQAKSEDEQKRAEVTADIHKIYDDTKTKVEGILAKMDQEAGQAFDQGAAAAKQSFENYIDSETEAHKQERYGGWLGWARWIKDKFKSDPEIDRIAERGKANFIKEMDAVIDNVVEIIARGITEAKAEIAHGKKEIQAYIEKLPADLQQVGQQAASDVQSKFDELESSVNDKQDELIDTLSNKYKENLDAVNDRVEAIKEANKGLIDRAVDAVGGVIKIILKLKDMLLNVLARVADAVGKIIKDPIGFLGNLLNAVKQGFNQFVGKIDVHLKKGLIAWLTGTIAGAGITLPDKFDLKGIFQLVMQLLGITFGQIMGKISTVLGFDVMGLYNQIMGLVTIYQEQGLVGLAKLGLEKLIGQQGMEALMQVVNIFEVIKSGDLGRLWGIIKEHLTSLKEMVMDKIQEFIGERVIKAGITWLLSLFNPAGAFIKACKMIYDVVMFFIQRGSQIMSLVNSIIDSVGAIASGSIGTAASFIEASLAKAIPVAISFLSSLLGLGDISGKVKEIIQNVRAMVDKAIDSIMNSKPVQMVAGFIKKVIGKVKNLAKAGLEKAKGALGFGKEEANQDLSDEKKEQLKAGKAAFATEERNYAKNGKIGFNDAQTVAASVKQQHSIFTSVQVVDGGDSWDYEYIVQRTKEDTKETTKAEDEEWIADSVTGDIRKFTEYVLVPDHPTGKDKIFLGTLGYRPRNQEDGVELLGMYVSQAQEKFNTNDYVVGTKDEYGQRFTITITVKGKNLKTGWILKDKTLKLSTPFSGFA
jgi:hypothetical protein